MPPGRDRHGGSEARLTVGPGTPKHAPPPARAARRVGMMLRPRFGVGGSGTLAGPGPKPRILRSWRAAGS